MDLHFSGICEMVNLMLICTNQPPRSNKAGFLGETKHYYMLNLFTRLFRRRPSSDDHRRFLNDLLWCDQIPPVGERRAG